MAIDPYALCPGGTGKKLKFCCPDLLSELEKIQRMIKGEQYVACLEHVEAIEEKYPDRACLLSLKTMMQTQLRMTEKAAETLGRFMEKYPENPVALAEQAALQATREGAAAGIATLQSALEASGREMPSELYSAIGVIAEAALAEGMFPAARAHLMLQMSIAGREDERPLSLLVRLNGSPSVPLLLKQDLRYPTPPDDALWKNSFVKAMEPANRGAWRAAAQNLEKLAAEVGDWPAIWQSVAILKMMLGDHPGAVIAWRKFAAQPQLPLDEAIEAEAVAQMLDPETYADETDVVLVSYPIPDMEQLLARLPVDKRIARMDIDLTQLGREGEPPPKAAFWLLDRPMPAIGVGIARADVPNVIGQLFVFGRQTDREARLELVAFREPELQPAMKMLAEVAGEILGAAGPEQVESHVPTAQHVLSWNWRLPDDTPLDHRRKLLDEQRREVILERWPKLSLRFLDGKTPEVAASDPQYRVRVLAAMLLLETSGESIGEAFDYNELRRKLGLPTADPIDPAQHPVVDLALVRLARLDVKKLSDDELVFAFQRAQHYRHVAALRKLGMEIVSRPSLDAPAGQKGAIDKSQVYGELAQVEPDAQASLGYIEKARGLAQQAGKSCAPWDIAELTLRIARQDLHEAQHLIQHIQQAHLREPGVAQAFVHVLVEAGILNPDGTPVALPGEAAPGIVVPGARPRWRQQDLDARRRTRGWRRKEIGDLDARLNPSMSDPEADLWFMRRALELAARGQGFVEPNPMVGAVLVRDGHVVAEGFHRRFGQAHAEVDALSRYPGAASGATLYVTLEPCCHQGKTPPCTKAIIAAGICRVVVAMQDPFPVVAGKGLVELAAAGIQTDVGLLEAEAASLNAPYLKLVKTGRPWVTAKWAMTLDGKLASRGGESRWISSEASRAIVHALRGRMDAILVGSETVLCDDPLLTARPPGSRTPVRVVVDSGARLALSSQLVRTARETPVLIAVGKHAPPQKLEELAAAGVEILPCDGETHRQRLEQLLDTLGGRRLTNVLVEGGGKLLGSLFDMDQIDEVHAFIAPKLLGGSAAPTPLAGEGFARIGLARRLVDPQIEFPGGDIYVSGRLNRQY